MKIFETPRLLIRELEANDISHIYAYGKELIVFEFQNYGPITLENAEGFYKRSLKDQQLEIRKRYSHGVILKATGKLIGDCGYRFEDDQLTIVQIGYNLHPGYWGKGLGTELVNHLIKNTLNKHKGVNIVAECDSRNIGSKRVLEKNGFELVELRKEDFEQKGVLIDTCRYKLNILDGVSKIK